MKIYPRKNVPWTVRELQQLGKVPDSVLARRTGRTIDREIARRLGRPVSSVKGKRQALQILAGRKQ